MEFDYYGKYNYEADHLQDDMTEKHMDDITLARKCNISPMNIVNIKNGSHTYSQQLVENLGSGLELNADEMRGFMGVAGF